MPLPSINIVFRELGIAAIRRSQKGVVALILKDAKHLGGHTLADITDLPKELGAHNQSYIKQAFVGYQTPPRQVLLYVMDGTDTTLTDALQYFSAFQFDYLAGPPELLPEESADIASWVKSQRQNDHLVKAVLPKTAADSEAIVNFTAQDIRVGSETVDAAGYCARIAGLIAGTPMTISCTYAPLPEVSDVARHTKPELDTAIDRGEFILFHDGEKVKVGRGVNSFVTLTQDKLAAFQKIKIVEAMDMIKNDIRITAQDHYIGKYANSYDNKCLLIIAIKGYFEELELAGILEKGTSSVAIDVPEQSVYLKKKGVDTAKMTDQEIKEANTGNNVFLAARISILDAIEDINIGITI